MKIVINDFDALKSGFEPVPVGGYKVKVTAVDPTKRAGDQSQMIGVEFTIIEGDYVGRKVFLNLSMKAPGMIKGFVEACQAPFEKDGFATEDLLGKDLLISVDFRTADDGRVFNNVKKWEKLQ